MSKTKKKRHGAWKWIVLVLLLAVIAVGLRFFLRGGAPANAVNYQAYTATIGTVSNALSFSGNLQAIDSQSYAANSATTVRNVYVSEGDVVKEGDKLLRLASGQTVTADFDGRVNKVYVEKDDEVSAGDVLAQVVDFTHLKVSVRVDEYDIEDVWVGQSCFITTTATGRVFESEIASIDYLATASNGSVAYYNAEAYVDVEDGAWPGMQITLTIPQEEATDVVILKEDALSFDETNQAFVYKLNDAGEYVPTPIEVGVTNGNYVEIKGGVKDGETVYGLPTGNTSADPFESMFGGRGGRNDETGAPGEMPSGGPDFGGGNP